MIHVKDLIKNYGRFEAVKGISFDVPAGQVVGFLGPNGAGKTTTMRMLTGYLGTSGGTIEIDGASILESPEKSRSKIGYLPENNPLYEDMAVVEYLRFVGQMRSISPDKIGESVDKNLNLYGLSDVAYKDIAELSKGYRQRVGLAAAAIDDPPILILDEPTSGLDPNQIVEIRNLIKEIGKEKTVILSTHNLAEVEATCSRIIIISKGRIVADQATEELEKGGSSTIVRARIKAGDDIKNILTDIAEILDANVIDQGEGWATWELAVKADTGQDEFGEKLFDTSVQNGWKLGGLYTESTSLEQIFAQLTKPEQTGGEK